MIDTGNPLHVLPLHEPYYGIVYLELAACRLTVLPGDLGQLVPNVRVLNLNYNFIEDPGPLGGGGLARLRKLTMIGSRVRGTKGLVRMLRGLPDVEMLDFRYVVCACCDFRGARGVTMLPCSLF